MDRKMDYLLIYAKLAKDVVHIEVFPTHHTRIVAARERVEAEGGTWSKGIEVSGHGRSLGRVLHFSSSLQLGLGTGLVLGV